MSNLSKYHEHITLFLDFSCPWSYIGWRNLCAVIEKLPAHYQAPQLIYRSYELNSNIPIEQAMDFSHYMVQRFSDQASILEWQNVIMKAAAESGIEIDFSRISAIFNTRLLHRMMHGLHKSSRLHEFIAQAFHQTITYGAILNNVQSINEIMDFDYHESLAKKPEAAWDQMIEQDLWYANHAGVSGIPCYHFGRSYMVFGAQTPQGYSAMFDLLHETRNGLQQDNALTRFKQSVQG